MRTNECMQNAVLCFVYTRAHAKYTLSEAIACGCVR